MYGEARVTEISQFREKCSVLLSEDKNIFWFQVAVDNVWMESAN